MSSNYLIAEKHSQMGLPEIRFNLFPGMGAYSFLARKVGMMRAEEMITSGKVYSGPELHKMGIIDILAESGKGFEAVDCFIAKHRRNSIGLHAVQKIRQYYNPVTYEEMMEITKVWVDAALQLGEKDLRTMARFVVAQNRGQMTAEHKPKKLHLVRTKQDRRINDADATFPLTDARGDRVICDRRSNYDRRAIDFMEISN
jgi:DSF synthase